MNNTPDLAERLSALGWTHDPASNKWTKTAERKVLDYKDTQHTTLYVLGTTGEHYAAWISSEEFALLALWVAAYTEENN